LEVKRKEVRLDRIIDFEWLIAELRLAIKDLKFANGPALGRRIAFY
jgi:hypothetical protein